MKKFPILVTKCKNISCDRCGETNKIIVDIPENEYDGMTIACICEDCMREAIQIMKDKFNVI